MMIIFIKIYVRKHKVLIYIDLKKIKLLFNDIKLVKTG